jgi:hypothetical protein
MESDVPVTGYVVTIGEGVAPGVEVVGCAVGVATATGVMVGGALPPPPPQAAATVTSRTPRAISPALGLMDYGVVE